MAKEGKQDIQISLSEETFVQELIKGLSQRKAYLLAYPNRSHWKEKTIDEKASKLFKKDKIMARFEQLRKKLVKKSEEKTIIEAKEVLEIYTRIARGIEEEEVFVNAGGFMGSVKKTKKASLKDRIKALERLDKILNIEKDFEDNGNLKDDGLTKQLEKIADGDIWEGFEDDNTED